MQKACDIRQNLNFISLQRVDERNEIGKLKITYNDTNKPGWIVDGQQRTAAIRIANRSGFPVSVVAFESNNAVEEREQFVLINNTRPLPKSLVYELLPGFEEHIPKRLKKRREAYLILEKLNLDINSPFYMRIRTVTYRGYENLALV